MEREEAEKALQKAQEWRERQIKEITEQKDEKIKELEDKIKDLKFNQNKETETEARILVLEETKMPGSWPK